MMKWIDTCPECGSRWTSIDQRPEGIAVWIQYSCGATVYPSYDHFQVHNKRPSFTRGYYCGEIIIKRLKAIVKRLLPYAEWYINNARANLDLGVFQDMIDEAHELLGE